MAHFPVRFFVIMIIGSVYSGLIVLRSLSLPSEIVTDKNIIPNSKICIKTGKNNTDDSVFYQYIKNEHFYSMALYLFGRIMTGSFGPLITSFGARRITLCILILAAILANILDLNQKDMKLMLLPGLGVLETLFIIAANYLISNWIPVCERELAVGFFYAVEPLAMAFTLFLRDYPQFCYNTMAILMCIHCVLCYFFVTDELSEHWIASEEEKRKLAREVRKHHYPMLRTIPFKAMVKSTQTWIIIIASYGHGFGNVVWSNYLPLVIQYITNNYLTKATYYYFYGIAYAALLLISVSLWVLSYFLSAYLRRTICNILGLIVPAVILFGLCLHFCEAKSTLIVISVGVCLQYFSLIGYHVKTFEIAPTYSATLCGASVSMHGLGALSATGWGLFLIGKDLTFEAIQAYMILTATVQLISAAAYFSFNNNYQGLYDKARIVGQKRHFKAREMIEMVEFFEESEGVGSNTSV